MFEIGTRPFAPVIEKPLIVVLRLQRFDLAIDEVVDTTEKLGDFLGNREIHGGSSNVWKMLAPYVGERTSRCRFAIRFTRKARLACLGTYRSHTKTVVRTRLCMN